MTTNLANSWKKYHAKASCLRCEKIFGQNKVNISFCAYKMVYLSHVSLRNFMQTSKMFKLMKGKHNCVTHQSVDVFKVKALINITFLLKGQNKLE